jgi:proteasome lid subunit RPN8/RPN11
MRVTMVDKNEAVVLLFASHIGHNPLMLSEEKKRKRKMWSKKWYLKWNISCDAHLLNELLKMVVP